MLYGDVRVVVFMSPREVLSDATVVRFSSFIHDLFLDRCLHRPAFLLDREVIGNIASEFNI